MTDRSKLLALAEAVEKLPGPDRGMDAEIAACLRIGTEHPWALNYPAWIATANGRVHLEKHGPSFASPTYTASLDAAMTLAEDGFGSLISGKYPDGRVGYVAVATHPARAEAEGLTKATAFAAAALRAQAEALA